MWTRLWRWINERWPAQAVVRTVLAEDIPGGASLKYSLGSTALFLFILQAATGVWQLFFYVPTVDQAYNSVGFLRTEVPFGWFIHNLHFWGATAMMAVVLLHMMRVFIWGAYKEPRQLTWLLGTGLFFLTMAMMFFGSPLPWNQKGYWATEVGTSIAGTVPVVGGWLRRLLIGGGSMGQSTLNRFFTLHVALLPGLLGGLILLHLVSFRRFGSVGPWREDRRSVSGPFWPDQVFKDLVMAAIVFLVLIGLCVFVPPGFTGAADPVDTSFIPKPEWNFLFLYQALKLFPGKLEVVGTMGIPLAGVLLLLLVPFLDRRPERNPARRPAAMGALVVVTAALVILSVLGSVSGPGDGRDARGALAEAQDGGQVPAGGIQTSSSRQQIGSAALGKVLFVGNCGSCHGPEGAGQVPNPGSEEGFVPALNPVDRDLYDPDPAVFVSRIDPYLQDGATPEGVRPALKMPAFGGTGALTQEQIANLEAYVMALNGVDRGRILRPGARPVAFFILTLAVFGGAALAFALIRPKEKLIP